MGEQAAIAAEKATCRAPIGASPAGTISMLSPGQIAGTMLPPTRTTTGPPAARSASATSSQPIRSKAVSTSAGAVGFTLFRQR
jgi:hypothetical protein